MDKHKIFISYCHDETSELNELLTFLKPLERVASIEHWSDKALAGGDRWREEIDSALEGATIAILLVSQGFMASDFITTKEMPLILGHEHQRLLTVLPVFLSPSSASSIPFGFEVERTGEQLEVRLTEFQGYASPGKTMADLGKANRQREYTRLVDDLRKRIERQPRESISRATSAARQSPYRQTDLPENELRLTAELRKEGTSLLTTFTIPGHSKKWEIRQPWAAAEATAKSIATRIDTANGHELRALWHTAPQETGADLFRLLLRDDTSSEALLRALFNRPDEALRPSPLYSGVTLRIATTEPALAGLPWHLIAWGGHLLAEAGWEIATTSVIIQDRNEQSTAPMTIVAFVPGSDSPEAEAVESRAMTIEEVVRRSWPEGRVDTYVKQASTLEELRTALQTHPPHLLYIEGAGRVDRGRPSLTANVDGAEQIISLLDIFRAISKNQSHLPSILFLDTPGVCCQAAMPPPNVFSAYIPLMIWQGASMRARSSTTSMLEWLSRWLAQGGDPLRALHDLRQEQAESHGELATLCANASYRHWSTTVPEQRVIEPGHARKHLDREHQKAMISTDVRKLARDNNARVLAVIASARPGNSLHLHHEQLRAFLDLDADDGAVLRWESINAPTYTHWHLEDALAQDLQAQLGARPQENLTDLIQRLGPDQTGKKQAMLWITWHSEKGMLAIEHIYGWLQLIAKKLAPSCPAAMRVICYIAFEAGDRDLKKLQESVQNAQCQGWARGTNFKVRLLEPLDKVPFDQLQSFIKDPKHTDCPDTLQVDMVKMIMDSTDGKFDQVVDLIEEAERSGWRLLHERLKAT